MLSTCPYRSIEPVSVLFLMVISLTDFSSGTPETYSLTSVLSSKTTPTIRWVLIPSARSLLAAPTSLSSLARGLTLNFLDASDHKFRRAHFDDLTSGKCLSTYFTLFLLSQTSSSLLELIRSPFFFSLNLYSLVNPETRARSSTSLSLSSKTTPSSSLSSLFGRPNLSVGLTFFDVGPGRGLVLSPNSALLAST